jgi:hypothetical protein
MGFAIKQAVQALEKKSTTTGCPALMIVSKWSFEVSGVDRVRSRKNQTAINTRNAINGPLTKVLLGQCCSGALMSAGFYSAVRPAVIDRRYSAT